MGSAIGSGVGDFRTPTDLDVLRQEAVEEVDVGGAEVDEVLVLLNRRLLELKDFETFPR